MCAEQHEGMQDDEKEVAVELPENLRFYVDELMLATEKSQERPEDVPRTHTAHLCCHPM